MVRPGRGIGPGCTGKEPHPGAHQPTGTLGQSSQNGLGTTSKQAAQGGQNLNIKIRFARLSRHQERDGRPQKTAILNYTHTPRERGADIEEPTRCPLKVVFVRLPRSRLRCVLYGIGGRRLHIPAACQSAGLPRRAHSEHLPTKTLISDLFQTSNL